MSEIRTTVRVALEKMVLVGGMTIDPTSPATIPITTADGPATRPAAASGPESKPQLHLFIEVTAG